MSKIKYFWPAIIWSGVIWILCSSPGSSFPSQDWMNWIKLDKWVHAFIYAVQFLAFQWAFWKMNLSIKGLRLSVLFAVLYCIVFGIGIELVQASLLTDRSGDLPDVVANLFGVLFGIMAVRIYFKTWPWSAYFSSSKGDNEGTV